MATVGDPVTNPITLTPEAAEGLAGMMSGGPPPAEEDLACIPIVVDILESHKATVKPEAPASITTLERR